MRPFAHELHHLLQHHALIRLLEYKEAAGDIQGAERLKQVSPVAWQHINFFGRYEFRKGPEAINMREIVRELGPLPVRLVSGE